MRTSRLRGQGQHFVHAVTRIVGRDFLLGDREKEHFWKLIQSQSRFSGVRVVTACIMSNHVHLFLEQPDRERIEPLTEDLLFQRLPHIYSKVKVREIRVLYDRIAASGDKALLGAFFQAYARRMNDVSMFMKEVKQKFTQWYNRRTGRKGTLWEERFKSVLTDNDPKALLTMAAYIDLNPVRAGIVKRVEDYRWCGYGRAVGGDEEAREGLGWAFDHSSQVCGEDFSKNWSETSRAYRLLLHHEGREVTADPENGQKGRKGFTEAELEAVEKLQGKMPLPRVLRCRVRYFTDGAALGGAAFIENVFRSNRSHFGSKRSSGARRMRGADWGDLCVIRDLRHEVIT